MKKKITLLLLLAITAIGYSQNTFGEIKGKILDDLDNEGIPGAHVYVKVGETKFGTSTDINGKFSLKPLNPGTYTLFVSYTGKSTIKRVGTLVKPNKVIQLEDMFLIDSTLKGYTVIWHKIKLIDPEDATVCTIGVKEIQKSAAFRDIGKLLSTVSPGISVSENGEVYVKGSRNGAVQYFVDGVKTTSLNGIPGAAIQSISVYTGGVPAMYGDVTGGVVILETRSYFDLLREERAKNDF
jgi:hypothetical protein